VQEDDKKKRTALKEARIAFLEEEVPALVAKGASIGVDRTGCGVLVVSEAKGDVSTPLHTLSCCAEQVTGGHSSLLTPHSSHPQLLC
jgi:hypothetical protein